MRVKELLDKANPVNIIHPLTALDGDEKSYGKYLKYIYRIVNTPTSTPLYNLVIKATYDGVLEASFEAGWQSANIDLRTVKWPILANCVIETDFNLNDPRICDRIAFFILSECTAFGEDFGSKEVEISEGVTELSV